MALDPTYDLDENLFTEAAKRRYKPDELEARRRAQLRAIDERTVGVKPDLTDESMCDLALLSDPRNVQLRKDFAHLLEPNGLDLDGKPLNRAAQAAVIGQETNPTDTVSVPDDVIAHVSQGLADSELGNIIDPASSDEDSFDVAIKIVPRVGRFTFPRFMKGAPRGSAWFRWGKNSKDATEWAKRIGSDPKFRKEVIDTLQQQGVTKKHLERVFESYMRAARNASKDNPERITPLKRGQGVRRLMQDYPDTLPSGIAPLEDQDAMDAIFGAPETI